MTRYINVYRSFYGRQWLGFPSATVREANQRAYACGEPLLYRLRVRLKGDGM